MEWRNCISEREREGKALLPCESLWNWVSAVEKKKGFPIISPEIDIFESYNFLFRPWIMSSGDLSNNSILASAEII